MQYQIIALLFVTQLAFGQTDTIVQPFLAEIVSTFPNVRDITLSANGDEAYFTAQSHLNELSAILFVKKKNNQWEAAKITSFSGKYHDLEPSLSPDGLRLFFSSNRPLDKTTEEVKDYDIWYVERTHPNSVWSEPINLDSPVNSEYNEFYPSISNNKNLYFTCDLPTAKGKDDIFLCTWIDGVYEEPISLNDSINSAGYEFNAFIAQDESFIIFSGYNREDGLGSGDLYVSYKNEEGVWQKAQNMGSHINSNKMDYCPFVDIKTNTLYFTSKRTSIKPPTDTFDSINDLRGSMNRYQNGQSRLYKINID